MKIIIVTRFYPPDTGGGGIATYARYAATGFVRAGHQVRVISSKANGSPNRQEVEGVEVFRITPPFSGYRWSRIPLVGHQMRLIRDLVYAWRVRQLVQASEKHFAPDIVEYADIDAESYFHPDPLCPHVVKLHTPHAILKRYSLTEEMPYAISGIKWLEKKAICSATGLSSPSRYLAKEVAGLVGIDINRIWYVPNFIDTLQFSPVENEAEHSPLVLYVGRLEPRKGAVVFAEAIPMILRFVPDARFAFVGADRPSEDGSSQKAKLQEYFSRAGIQEKVEFHGHDSPGSFLSFYRRASVFVLPSLIENSPYTLLEAMACGRPCVVSRVGGMTEMLTDKESGFFFEPGNPANLAEKVVNLLQDRRLQESIGRAARNRVQRDSSLETGVGKTLDFYNKVISKNG